MLSRRTILLKPMRAALSGYARLQTENGHTLVQLHARGLSEGETRLFGYLPERTMRQLGSANANAHGEISLEISAPAPLQALILVDSAPRTLLIGLCEGSDAGRMLDVKNAALALCERLKAPSPKAEERPAPQPAIPQVSKPQKKPAQSKRKVPSSPLPPSLPREIFLPAIDPAPYTCAAIKEEEREETLLPPPKPAGPPVDRLRALRWPRGFEALKGYFDSHLPKALFPLPGWRFVSASDDLWIGCQAQDGCVRSVAYAYLESPPPGLRERCRPMQGLDGKTYQVLWMSI